MKGLKSYPHLWEILSLNPPSDLNIISDIRTVFSQFSAIRVRKTAISVTQGSRVAGFVNPSARLYVGK